MMPAISVSARVSASVCDKACEKNVVVVVVCWGRGGRAYGIKEAMLHWRQLDMDGFGERTRATHAHGKK